jgi:hypothetical protein
VSSTAPTPATDRFLPLSGVLAGLALAGGSAATFSEPTLESSTPTAYLDWVSAHPTALTVSALCAALTTFFLLVFAAQLRASIRAGEAGESTWSTVASAGAIGVALSLGGMAVIALAQAGADASAGPALAHLSDAAWLPWAASSGAMLLGTGIGALRTLALPRWLAVTTVVLGVLSITGPTGIAVFLVTPLWLVATGLVLSGRRSAVAGSVPQPAVAR